MLKGGVPQISPAEERRIVRLYLEGNGSTTISQLTGRSKTGVLNCLHRRLGVDALRPDMGKAPDPTPEEIQERIAEIQARPDWQRRNRNAGCQRWLPPVCDIILARWKELA